MLISSEQNHPHQVLLSRGFVWLFQTYILVFKWGFLETTSQPTTYNRPPTNRPTYHRPPTKCTDHRLTDHWPIRNMRSRNFIANFKWISDKKIWDCVINTISRMWVTIFLLKPECVIEKIKSLKVTLIKYKA